MLGHKLPTTAWPNPSHNTKTTVTLQHSLEHTAIQAKRWSRGACHPARRVTSDLCVCQCVHGAGSGRGRGGGGGNFCTLDTAQRPCHLLKPNWRPSSSHSISTLIMMKWCLMSSRMSVDILGTSCDQCRSTSTETRRLVRTNSLGRPPRLSHSSWTMN